MENIMKSLFTNTIPTNTIFGDHIKTDKMSDEYKEAVMRNFVPRSQIAPTDEIISKMAYSSGKRISQEEQSIQRDDSDWQKVVEANKSKKTSDPNLSLKGIRVAHQGGEDFSTSDLTPEMAKQILEKNKNYLQKGSAFSSDAAISDFSREEIRNKRRKTLEAKQNKHDIEIHNVVKSSDKDEITGIRKGISNISETASSPEPFCPNLKMNSPSEEEVFESEQNVATAIGLLQQHNKKKIEAMLTGIKPDWSEDALAKTQSRVVDSVEHLRAHQLHDIKSAQRIENVNPDDVAKTFKEYFENKQTALDKSSVEFSSHREARANAIRREAKVETTLDRPSLPTKTSNSFFDKFIDGLPEQFKQKALK